MRPEFKVATGTRQYLARKYAHIAACIEQYVVPES